MLSQSFENSLIFLIDTPGSICRENTKNKDSSWPLNRFRTLFHKSKICLNILPKMKNIIWREKCEEGKFILTSSISKFNTCSCIFILFSNLLIYLIELLVILQYIYYTELPTENETSEMTIPI